MRQPNNTGTTYSGTRHLPSHTATATLVYSHKVPSDFTGTIRGGQPAPLNRRYRVAATAAYIPFGVCIFFLYSTTYIQATGFGIRSSGYKPTVFLERRFLLTVSVELREWGRSLRKIRC